MMRGRGIEAIFLSKIQKTFYQAFGSAQMAQ